MLDVKRESVPAPEFSHMFSHMVPALSLWAFLVGFAAGGVMAFLRAVLSATSRGSLVNVVVEDAAKVGLTMAIGWYVAARVSGNKYYVALLGSMVGFIGGVQDLPLAGSLIFPALGGLLIGFFGRYSPVP